MSTLERRSKTVGDRWYVRYRDGKSSRQRVFETEAGALLFKNILDTDGVGKAEDYLKRSEDKPARTSYTVASWMAEHIDGLTGVTGGTQGDYRNYLETDIAQTPLGRLPLEAVTREAVGAWVNSLAAPRTRTRLDKRTGQKVTSELAGLSGKSIRNRHSLLSAALTTAVRAGHIPTNHAKGIRLPRTDHTRTEMTILSPEQQRSLIAAVDEGWRPLVATLLLTGLRFGEATALTVAHIRLDQGILLVRQAWKHTDGGAEELGPPKSAKGRRAVSLTDQALAVLEAACAGKRGEDWVFTRAGARPESTSTHVRHKRFYEAAWRPAVAKASLSPRPRIHDLRHTYASTMIAIGVPANHLQRQLGHESITTTFDTYGHLFPDAHQALRIAGTEAFSHLSTALPSQMTGAAPLMPQPPRLALRAPAGRDAAGG